jgi:methylenetetrahydrofolate reductase (NADPH)
MEEGVQISLEQIARIRKMQAFHGIHIMTVGWEEIVPRLVKESGIQPQDAGLLPLPESTRAIRS